MRIYMAVTADAYELPVLWEEKLCDLARRMGRGYGSLASMKSRGHRMKWGGGFIRVIRVEMDGGEDDATN